jgi:hypothetical protein
MMGLHDATKTIRRKVGPTALEIEDIPNLAEDDGWVEEDGECPECGSREWSNTRYGTYSENVYYTFGDSRWIENEGMEGTGQDDEEGWQCTSGHSATDTINELFEDIS